MNSVWKELQGELAKRVVQDPRYQVDELIGIYSGTLPARYQSLFSPEKGGFELINSLRHAWEDLADVLGTLPRLTAEPLDNTDAEIARTSLLERIGYAYLDGSTPSGKLFMWGLAWWLLSGRCAAVVVPDMERKMPRFELRDPRTLYPSYQSAAGFAGPLQDVVMGMRKTAAEVEAMGLRGKAGAMSSLDMVHPTTNANPLNTTPAIDVVVSMDRNSIRMATEIDAKEIRHDLGIIPAIVVNSFNPGNEYGLSQFTDQIPLIVGVSRLVAAKLTQVDRIANSILWARNFEGEVKIGPDRLVKLGERGQLGIISPTMQIQADRDIAMLTGFGRIYNRNPETRQGEIAGAGYVSAKTVSMLNDSVMPAIERYFATLAVGLRHLFKAAYAMDEKLWPNEKKTFTTTRKGTGYIDEYVASEAIDGRGDVTCHYDQGDTGYQGFIRALQTQQAGFASKRQTLELMPGIRDLDATMREIELDRMDEAGTLAFEMRAKSGQLDLVLWSKLRKRMQETGKPLAEIMLEYEEEVRAASQAAQSAGQEAFAPAPEPELAGIPPGAIYG